MKILLLTLPLALFAKQPTPECLENYKLLMQKVKHPKLQKHYAEKVMIHCEDGTFKFKMGEKFYNDLENKGF